MQRRFGVPVVLSGFLAILPAPLPAQNPDVDLMAKWSAYEIVRYAVVGEYSGEPMVMRGAQGISRKAKVTDRVELTFDWNQQLTEMAALVSMKNFPATMTVLPMEGCPATKVEGSYDHLEILSAKSTASVVEVAAQRRFPAGSIPYATEEECSKNWDAVTAKTEPATMMLIVPPTMYFGMPTSPGMTISKDKKSIILLDEANGWTWTYTPTPVK